MELTPIDALSTCKPHVEHFVTETTMTGLQIAAGIDRRHVVLIIGVASIVWDSMQEWRNPAPEEGWHYEIKEPVVESPSSIEFEEKVLCVASPQITQPVMRILPVPPFAASVVSWDTEATLISQTS